MKKKSLSGPTIIAVVIAGAIASVAASSGSRHFFEQLESRNETAAERMAKDFSIVAAEANARGPVKLDDDTRLEKTEAGPGARLTYFYTLTRYATEELDHAAAIEALKANVAKSACVQPDMRQTIDDGAVFVYAYAAKDGGTVGRFEINKQECGPKKSQS